MKSSYANDLNSANTKSNLCVCILIFNEPAQAHKRFKWYMEIKVINLMSYFFLNNVILLQENEKKRVPRWKSSLKGNSGRKKVTLK